MNSPLNIGMSFVFLMAIFCPGVLAAEPVDIGSRRELFVDKFLVQEVVGEAKLKLHQPTQREVAITFDEPWEGNSCGYPTVFQDGDIYRMYYRGHAYSMDEPPLRMAHSEVVCYAESTDGVHWVKPKLKLHKWPGVETNNIIWPGGSASHNFAPFKDANPDCLPDERYRRSVGRPRQRVS